MSQFTHQKLIIIGGTSGIGKAVARLVRRRGGNAVLVGNRPEKLQAAIADLSPHGPVFGEQANISDPEARQALTGRLNQHHADATLLVNSAADKASWVTGAVWDVDGGVMAGRNQYAA